MGKGKPWTVEEEQKLRELVKSGATVEKIASALGKSVDAIKHKINRLGLEVVVPVNFSETTTSKLDKNGELQSVEEALKLLNGALNALAEGGLDKTEIMRFRTIIQGTRIYMALLGEYIIYRFQFYLSAISAGWTTCQSSQIILTSLV